jgi:hypothetical protein
MILYEIIWHWQPFHQIGFDALKYAAQHKLNNNQIDKILSQLSCVGVPKRLSPKFTKQLQELNGLDEDGGVKTLSSENYIRETLKNFPSLSENFILPTISDLREALIKRDSRLVPLTKNTPEERIVSNYLTGTPLQLKEFHQMPHWSKLEVIECLVGSIFSSSKLKFGHLDV